MAELLLKVGTVAPDPHWQDGDVICAFNNDRIRCVHAQHICHPRVAARNASGLIMPGEHCQDWYEATHEFRFERVSATEMRRVVIASGKEEMFGEKPNDRGEYIDVRAFLAYRKRHPGHPTFGEDGAEIWYGGNIDVSHINLNAVWNAIETKTSHRESAFVLWPLGIVERKSHLAISVEDFDDAKSAEFESSEKETNSLVLAKKRVHKIDWQDKLGLSSADKVAILDKTQETDHRADVKPLNVIDRKTRIEVMNDRVAPSPQ